MTSENKDETSRRLLIALGCDNSGHSQEEAKQIPWD
jgi:hypothetical protein